jgi:hypothetical protein
VISRKRRNRRAGRCSQSVAPKLNSAVIADNRITAASSCNGAGYLARVSVIVCVPVEQIKFRSSALTILKVSTVAGA